jgi:hypothetical protein
LPAYLGAAVQILGEKLMSLLPFLAVMGLTASSDWASNQSEDTSASMSIGLTCKPPS